MPYMAELWLKVGLKVYRCVRRIH